MIIAPEIANEIYLTGERIFLRNLTRDDATDDYCRWMNDSKVNQYLESRFITHTTGSISHYIDEIQKQNGVIFLAICLRGSDHHIGNIKLGPIQDYHNHGEIGLMIGDKTEWGKGYAAEAISLIADYALDVLHLNAVIAKCYANNVGSMKAFEKAGFSVAGCLTQFYKCNGEYVDGIMLTKNSNNSKPVI